MCAAEEMLCPIVVFDTPFPENWQALPLFWQGLPKKWQGLPVMLNAGGDDAETYLYSLRPCAKLFMRWCEPKNGFGAKCARRLENPAVLADVSKRLADNGSLGGGFCLK